jgi:hypothetical protein
MHLIAFLRLQVALDWNRRLMHQPSSASCTSCGIQHPFALVLPVRSEKGKRVKKCPLLCYRCRSQRVGRSGKERHHLGGRPSPLRPVSIDANLHRVLTYLQHFWRRAGLAPGSPAALFDVIALLLVGAKWSADPDG